MSELNAVDSLKQCASFFALLQDSLASHEDRKVILNLMFKKPNSASDNT